MPMREKQISTAQNSRFVQIGMFKRFQSPARLDKSVLYPFKDIWIYGELYYEHELIFYTRVMARILFSISMLIVCE